VCGRYTLKTRRADVVRLFGVDTQLELPFRYNIAPRQPIPVVRLTATGGRELVALKWGLIPHWSRDGKGFINARSQSVADKPAGRSPSQGCGPSGTPPTGRWSRPAPS